MISVKGEMKSNEMKSNKQCHPSRNFKFSSLRENSECPFAAVIKPREDGGSKTSFPPRVTRSIASGRRVNLQSTGAQDVVHVSSAVDTPSIQQGA